MADADPTAGGANRLTWAELIRAEIEGKDKALKGYDEILWKIRSGYAVKRL